MVLKHREKESKSMQHYIFKTQEVNRFLPKIVTIFSGILLGTFISDFKILIVSVINKIKYNSVFCVLNC